MTRRVTVVDLTRKRHIGVTLLSAAFGMLLVATVTLAAIPTLSWSVQAREQLREFRTSDVEHYGCLYGSRFGSRVTVREIRPATVARRGNLWASEAACADKSGLIGFVHNHPGGIRCFYQFPGTTVSTSDLASFRASGRALDAIVCGDFLLWMLRDENTHAEAL